MSLTAALASQEALVSLEAGGPDPALQLAGRFLAAGDFDAAVTEYKRYIFFSATAGDPQLSEAYRDIGLAFRSQGRWAEAREALNNSIQSASDEQFRDLRRIDLAVVEIAAGNRSAAEFLLVKVEMFSRDEAVKRRAAFFRGVCALYGGEWDKAGEAFAAHFNSATDHDFLARLQELLARAKKRRLKSPILAKWMSILLPGSGQIYSGYWGNGLNALVINGALGYLLVKDLLDRQAGSFIFNTIFLFSRFYLGNIHIAKDLANRRNQELKRRAAADVMDLLQERLQ